jgi:hypothetical protein
VLLVVLIFILVIFVDLIHLVVVMCAICLLMHLHHLLLIVGVHETHLLGRGNVVVTINGLFLERLGTLWAADFFEILIQAVSK